ncbi:MAG: peptide ABC transporter substrate-binding protein [Candidatus Melainabacteria bacterium]|nr:peptide ABC transporter substrate-binding protein [Candidatus Melainabacteria bacterium]
MADLKRLFGNSPPAAKLCLVLWAILCFAGCSFPAAPSARDTVSDSTPANARVFRMNLGSEPPNLDPPRVTDLTSFNVVQNLMRGLTQFDARQQVVPAVAERWTVSPDGKVYTFYIHPKARWSDGKPVTANDFVYAWQRALDPALGAEYAFFLHDIVNAKAWNEGKLKDPRQLGIRALNLRTLQVTLNRPVAFFPSLLASPVALPVRQDVVARNGAKWTEAGRMVTNGPYRLAEWIHEQRIVLTPDPDWFLAQPKVARVEMLMVTDANTSVVMYENDELDFIETTTSIPPFEVRRLQHRPDAHRLAIHRNEYVGFNTRQPPFNQVKVRQAFAHAIDRSLFPTLLQSGQQPLASLITPGLVGYNPKRGLMFNPQRAKQLLAEAGYPQGKGFPSVSLSYRTSFGGRREAEILQFLWKKHLGVDVNLKNMEWKVLLSQLKQNPPPMYRLGWYVDYPDADSFMTLFIRDNGNNYTGWHDPRYDRWVRQAAETSDGTTRVRLYDQAQHLLLERDTAIAPLYVGEKLYLHKPHVCGLVINRLNLMMLDALQVGADLCSKS